MLASCASTGAPPERLCAPLVDYITARGGEVQLNSRLQEIELAEDGAVTAFRLSDGRRVEGDLYISSMPGRFPLGLSSCCWPPGCCAGCTAVIEAWRQSLRHTARIQEQ